MRKREILSRFQPSANFTMAGKKVESCCKFRFFQQHRLLPTFRRSWLSSCSLLVCALTKLTLPFFHPSTTALAQAAASDHLLQFLDGTLSASFSVFLSTSSSRKARVCRILCRWDDRLPLYQCSTAPNLTAQHFTNSVCLAALMVAWNGSTSELTFSGIECCKSLFRAVPPAAMANRMFHHLLLTTRAPGPLWFLTK